MGHIDLAAHLQKFRCVQQFLGNILDGGQVFGHILAHYAVTTGRTTHKSAVFILKAYGKTVNFHFNHITGRNTLTPHSTVEIPQLLIGKRILKAFHFYRMGHLGEFPGRSSAHMLGGRIRCDQLRELRFQLLQLPV